MIGKKLQFDLKSTIGTRLGVAFLVLIFLQSSSCDYLDKNTTTTNPESQTLPQKPPKAPAIAPEQIELFDTVMQRLDERALTGDLRPFWKISGRIRNNSDQRLGGLLLRVYVIERGGTEIQDEVNLRLETDISSRSVGSFSRQIQLLPPQKPWSWNYEIVEAHVKER